MKILTKTLDASNTSIGLFGTPMFGNKSAVGSKIKSEILVCAVFVFHIGKNWKLIFTDVGWVKFASFRYQFSKLSKDCWDCEETVSENRKCDFKFR